MAVYTNVSETDIQKLRSLYALNGEVKLKAIAEGVENSNYLLTAADKRYILTLYEKRVNPADLPFFLELLTYLAEKGVPCPLPVKATDGKVIQEVAGRPAAMVSFLEGQSVKKPAAVHCGAVGEHLALMHLASNGYAHSRANSLSLAGWKDIWAKIQKPAAEAWPEAIPFVEEAMARLEKAWPQHLPKGIIHADLFPDNVFFEGDVLSGLIDFYFACNDLFAYDLAICLNAWCFENNREFNITKSQRMLEAYVAKRPLNAEERDAFPILCLGASMRFLMTRMHDWLNPQPGALVTPKDPMEYMQKLKFHLTAADYHAYGI